MNKFTVVTGIVLALGSLNSIADARADLGEPAAKLTLQDGTERRFYTTGPAGTRTYRVDVSSAGKVLGTAQVLNEDSFQKIRAGMLATDVFASIGPPHSKMRFKATKTTAWDYHFRDLWNYDADFSVIVDDAGVVVGKFTSHRTQ